MPNGSIRLFFYFQKVLYTFDENKRQFHAIEFDTNHTMGYYQEYKGLKSDEEIAEIKLEYGTNKLN